MFWGAGVLTVVVGVAGAVLLVVAVLLGRRWGARRAVGGAGAGVLLLGLSVSGIVNVIAQVLAVGFNPVRWVGLAGIAVGTLMLSWAGMLPGRRRSQRTDSGEGDARQVGEQDKPRQVGRKSDTAPSAGTDDDLAEIEDILRRRGIE